MELSAKGTGWGRRQKRGSSHLNIYYPSPAVAMPRYVRHVDSVSALGPRIFIISNYNPLLPCLVFRSTYNVLDCINVILT